ncbi:PAS-domain containing protein [Sphingobium phenoxybenzoativorans]|uniref:histidine kinase n=1 Tax=Sphingobium phenoxybenzoativorans TaxID=1592790 RepID=A0A975KAT2_9SPHN|nr:PAS domain-containing sensor histidine kinase [Sphingobium phenoxybenzoativorans]QUT07981.1 PAS-domain containing protein [Sphingobium phenoxybenzoativorans]
MVALSSSAVALIGAILALWLAVAVWAVHTGLGMRRHGAQARAQMERIANLLHSAPAIPVLVRADGRVEAPDRLGRWLGLDRAPAYLSELTAPDGGLTPEDADLLAKDVVAAQKAGKSFVRPVRAQGSERSLLVKGGPGGPGTAAPDGVILWVFDATESQSEIGALQEERDHLRAALESLSGLIEAAPMPTWHRNGDFRLTLVNSAYVEAVDARSANQVIGDGIELVEALDGQSPKDAAALALASGKPLARMVPATINGERRMMRVIDIPLGNAGVAGFAIDVHELDQARAETRRLAEAQRDLLDRLSAGVAQFGADRSLRFWNQPFTSLFALQPEHLAEAPEFERVLDRMREAGRVPEHRDFPAWRAERRDWFLSPEAREENWLLADGTHLRVFAQPLPDGGLLTIFEDRTEHVQLSSARDTLLRVRTATFDNLFEAIGVFSSDGRLHMWNNRFRRIWDMEEAMLAGHPRIDVLMQKVASRLIKPHQASLVRELVRAATVERKQRGGRVAFADGRIFDFAAIPLPDGNALFTMLDVTDSRRVEQILRDRNEALEEADKLKTAFLSTMSYELRTPLTSITGFAEMMQAGYAGELPPAARDYTDAIMQSTGRLQVLIDNLLDLTQGEAGNLPLDKKPIDLATLAAEAMARVRPDAEAKAIDLAVELKPSLGQVTGDARRIGQALDRLLENAVRYSPEGGRVLLHGDGREKTARLVVSDNGPGMDAKAQARAFDRFSRANRARKGEALGLGLPLAKQMVEAHGGTLTLLSEVGQGTVVTMELPRG